MKKLFDFLWKYTHITFWWLSHLCFNHILNPRLGGEHSPVAPFPDVLFLWRCLGAIRWYKCDRTPAHLLILSPSCLLNLVVKDVWKEAECEPMITAHSARCACASSHTGTGHMLRQAGARAYLGDSFYEQPEPRTVEAVFLGDKGMWTCLPPRTPATCRGQLLQPRGERWLTIYFPKWPSGSIYFHVKWTKQRIWSKCQLPVG